MALTPISSVHVSSSKRDPRALKIVAKSIYRELVEGEFTEQDVMALAGELLALVANGVRARRDDDGQPTTSPV
ncbi:MAG: hypothetical protein NVS3B20_15060 [Polyangiales bacterium]